MANLTIYQNQDFSNPTTGYGSVVSSTSTAITIKDNLGDSLSIFGTFYYSGGNLSSGTVSSLTSVVNYVTAYGIFGTKADALTVLDYVSRSDIKSLNEYILSGADTISASAGDDVIMGYGGNDIIYGNAGNDIIYAGNGNDDLYGGAGNDVLDGGAGLDRAIYTGLFSAYTVSRDLNGYTYVTDKTGLYGSDTLIQVERIVFSDRTVALDIDGNAGQSYRIYQAAFNRTPDNGGLKYWIGLMDSGVSLATVSSAFIASAEFQSLYGVIPKNDQFVTKLYSNVLHRTPDQGGYDYWVGLLNDAKIDKTSTLINFSESAENQAGVMGAIQNGIDLFLI